MRRSRKSWIRVLALIGALALVLAACPDPDPVDPEVDPELDPEEPVDDEALRLGYILPETGPLAFLGPAQITPLEMAISEANDAGGVLGNPVELIGGDEAGDAAVAAETADRLLGEGVHAIIGAAASGMSLAIIDAITGAGVVQCSASNTAPTFTDYEDGGYYFRTAPSDAMQGVVLAEVILEDGHFDVALLARADDYGVGLMDMTADTLAEAGANIVYQQAYDPEQVTFTTEVGEMIAEAPDAIVIIPFDEGIEILVELIEQGFDINNVYGVDGIRAAGLNMDVDPDDPNAIDGFKGTNPEPAAAPGFIDRLQEFAPDLDEFTFAPHAYDCANWVMLAAEAAGSVDSTAIRDSMFDVIDGDNECNNFPDCAEFLRDGQTVAYQFATGTTDWADVGEPAAGQFEIWEWQDAELVSIDTVEFILE
jgi:ABC-type branched-subunit amino acid transport system substrate-binding protein